MSLAKKLNLKEGMKLRVVSKPAGVDLDDVATTTTSATADAILVFVKTLAEVDAMCGPVLEAAKEDTSRGSRTPKRGSWARTSIETSSGDTS